jgi:flagellar basal body-associated protein FliL
MNVIGSPEEIAANSRRTRCIIIVVVIAVAVVLITGIVLAIIFFGNSPNVIGCTERGYDNYVSNAGTDDGSCYYNHNNHNTKTIQTCPAISSEYYDPGKQYFTTTPHILLIFLFIFYLYVVMQRREC